MKVKLLGIVLGLSGATVMAQSATNQVTDLGNGQVLINNVAVRGPVGEPVIRINYSPACTNDPYPTTPELVNYHSGVCKFLGYGETVVIGTSLNMETNQMVATIGLLPSAEYGITRFCLVRTVIQNAVCGAAPAPEQE